MKEPFFWPRLLATAFAVCIGLSCSKPPEVPAIQPVRQDLATSLTTNGRVDPTEDFAVFATTAGRIRSVEVEEGDHVRKGALLVTISDQISRARLEQAQAQLEAAQAELATMRRGGTPVEIAELKAELASVKRAKQQAEETVEALQRLVGKQAAVRIELEEAENLLAAKKAEADLLQEKLEFRPGPQQLAKAEARVREARAALSIAEEQLKDSVIRTPITGMVYSLDVRRGAFVTEGSLIARVGKIDQIKIVIFVDEPELGEVKLGTPVTITADAFPKMQWTGQVDRLPTEIVSLETRRVGEVWSRVANSGGELIPNLTVSVEIKTADVKGALTLPREAIVREGAEAYVWLAGPDNVAQRRQVELGIRNPSRVQVTSGLEGDERVLLPGDVTLEGGQRVTPVGHAP